MVAEESGFPSGAAHSPPAGVIVNSPLSEETAGSSLAAKMVRKGEASDDYEKSKIYCI